MASKTKEDIYYEKQRHGKGVIFKTRGGCPEWAANQAFRMYLKEFLPCYNGINSNNEKRDYINSIYYQSKSKFLFYERLAGQSRLFHEMNDNNAINRYISKTLSRCQKEMENAAPAGSHAKVGSVNLDNSCELGFGGSAENIRVSSIAATQKRNQVSATNSTKRRCSRRLETNVIDKEMDESPNKLGLYEFDDDENANKKIYEGEDLEKLLKEYTNVHVAELGVPFKVVLDKVITKPFQSPDVPNNGPSKDKSEDGMAGLFKSDHCYTAAEYGNSLEQCLGGIVASLGYSRDRACHNVLRLKSNRKGPHLQHYDVQNKQALARMGRRSQDSRPLTVLAPTSPTGMYLQVWLPNHGRYGHVIHIKFGQALIFEPTLLHSGNILAGGGDGEKELECPRIHVHMVANPSDGDPTALYGVENGWWKSSIKRRS